MVLALCQFTEAQHMFFLTIGGDGSRQVGSDALIFIRLLQQKSKNISSIHKAKNFYRKNKWFLHFANLLNHSTCFFSLLATTGAASLPQMPSFSFGFYSKSQKNSRDLNEAKICNGKTKGLGTLPIYIRTAHVFFTIGDDGSRQCRSDAIIFIRLLPLKSKFMSCFW